MKERKVETPLLGRGLRVSTVEIFVPGARSKLYETVVFHRETGGKFWDMKESSNWREALTSHKQMVAKWKAVPRGEIRGRLVPYKNRKRPR